MVFLNNKKKWMMHKIVTGNEKDVLRECTKQKIDARLPAAIYITT